jgi:cell division protein FtsB
MNLTKQREIMALKAEVEELKNEFIRKRNASYDQQAPVLLDAAFSELMTFLEGEGFTATENHQGIITATSEEGIVITIDKKPRIFSVSMPNMEHYSVSIESTLEDFPLAHPSSSEKQDAQIQTYKNDIEKLKKQINTLETVAYRYILSIEPRDGNYDNHEKRTYLQVSSIISAMFS